MLDKDGRILIPKEFKVLKSEEGKVVFYYSVEEKLFYIRFEEVSDEFLIDIRKMDKKNRVFFPKQIVDIYKTENILVAKKDSRIYFLPLKEE